MSQRFTFPAAARLHRERDFKRAYREGRRLRVFPLRFHLVGREEGQSRLGMAIGRKLGGAVARNRWKREIRKAFRLNRHRLLRSYDIVVSADWQARPGQIGQVAGAFLEMIEQLNAAETAGGTK